MTVGVLRSNALRSSRMASRMLSLVRRGLVSQVFNAMDSSLGRAYSLCFFMILSTTHQDVEHLVDGDSQGCPQRLCFEPPFSISIGGRLEICEDRRPAHKANVSHSLKETYLYAYSLTHSLTHSLAYLLPYLLTCLLT